MELMKTQITLIALLMSFFATFAGAADPPYHTLMVKAEFDDTKSLMLAVVYGTQGEIAIGTEVEADKLKMFHGRRVIVKTGSNIGDSDFVEVVYESSGKPSYDEKSGVIEQDVVMKRLLVKIDGKEKVIKLGGGKTLTLQLTTIKDYGENKLEMSPADAAKADPPE